ncbi:hypothetical protein B9P52_03540 [Achromobacter denitrificans]|nr:hypothetical protein [Achromobacter denitrificans]ASC68699.1 hypothetical protein B9P52_03540 [Achromobacter denitrificans]
MFHNNMVYKRHRPTASVSRISVGGSGRSAFTAAVAVELAGNQDKTGESHTVPLFASGGFVSSPGMAVDAAITHGRVVVDAHARPA